MNPILSLAAALCLLAATSLSAAEYFIAPHGSDTAGGLTLATPLQTFDRAKTLIQPGDTVTFLPGEYHEGGAWRFSGGDAVTRIRALIPGTVHLRGDTPAGPFTPMPELPRVYVSTFAPPLEGVLERDTLTRYSARPNPDEVSRTPGSCYVDREAGRLYIHTTDSAPPQNHVVTLIRLPGDAFRISPAGDDENDEVRNLDISGFVISGFNSASTLQGGTPTFGGIYIRKPRNCRVSHCEIYLNGSGIVLSRPTDSLIEDCWVYANDNDFGNSGGNIICFNPTLRTTIRRCYAFASKHSGIRMYGGTPAEESLIDECVAHDNDYGDIWIKYPSDTSVVRRSFASNSIHSRLIENSIFTSGDSYYFGAAQSSIARARDTFNPDHEFAEPGKYDFRLQADSQFRSRPDQPFRGIRDFDPAILFVATDGNDDNDGNSLRTPLKTLAAATARLADGGTLYLAPGTYAEDLTLTGRRQITLAGRGLVPAVISGRLTLQNCAASVIKGINVLGGLNIDNQQGLYLRACAFAGASTLTGSSLTLKHNAFTGPLTVNGTAGLNQVQGNIITGTYEARCDYSGHNAFATTPPAGEINSVTATPDFTDPARGIFTLSNPAPFHAASIDGAPVGPYRWMTNPAPVQTPGPQLCSLTATTANIEFFSSRPSSLTVSYGPDPSCAAGKTATPAHYRSFLGSISLTGLTPGQTVHYRLRALSKPASLFSNAPFDPARPTPDYDSGVLTFTTPAQDEPPRTLHVAPDGDDQRSGLGRTEAWRTLNQAARMAKAGDTVLIQAGNYQETVRLRGTGEPGRPIRFQAAPGARVSLDGADKMLGEGLVIIGKNQIEIDGLRFTALSSSLSSFSAGIVALQGEHLRISRCFHDGRPPRNSPNFIRAENVSHLLMENCVVYRGFHGFSFARCPGLEVRHCVFMMNQVNHGSLHNDQNQPSNFHHNIWAGHELQKAHNPNLNISDVASFQESHNCFLVRLPADTSPIFGIVRNNGETLPLNDPDPILTAEWKRQGRFGNDNVAYAEFCRKYQRQPTALFVDPGMPALPGFTTFTDPANWRQNYFKPHITGPRNRNEMNMNDDGTRKPLDFAHFFATHPAVTAAGIGLQPERFKDLP